MKKLVYMLTLAIGLIMTGCAQWEKYEPMPNDTWGAVSELTVETPDTVTGDVLPIKIITKNATNLSLLLSDAAVAEINYTDLLQGYYEGALTFERNAEGDTLAGNLGGVVAGNTYYLYVVAANSAGVQTTFEKTIGAVDVEVPVCTSTFPLTATNKGHTVTLSFNENITREAGMGAVSYKVYDTNVEVVAEGNIDDASLVASGNRLTVTLPATVEFAEGVQYVVVLSFAEGAVTDLFGNKMAAMEGYIDADYMVHGAWWSVELSSQEDTGFLKAGAYVWSFTYDDGQNPAEALISNTAFEYIGKAEFMLSQTESFPADQWSVSGFMTDVIQLNNATPFAGFAFEYPEIGQIVTFLDATQENWAFMGAASLEGGGTAQMLFAAYEGNSLTLPLFIHEGGVLTSISNTAMFMIVDNQLYLAADLLDLVITPSGQATVSNMEAVKQQIANFNPATAKKIEMNKVRF